MLVSGASGRHRLTLRHDRFDARDLGPLVQEDDNSEDGTAWTAAYVLKLGEQHRLALEALRVESTRGVRAALGLPPKARELLLQASLRLRF